MFCAEYLFSNFVLIGDFNIDGRLGKESQLKALNRWMVGRQPE